MSFANEVDIAVIGAGAAGIAAARRLAERGASFVVLEARGRIGGRAHTVQAAGLPVDLGCGWLHGAEHNPWTAISEALGLTVDRSPPPWMKQAFDVGFSAEEQAQYRQAFVALDERVEAAADEPDRPVSELFTPGSRWNPLLDAFSGFYNGAPFTEISVQDYAAYDDAGSNWRVREGYGTAIAAYGAGLPLALETPVAAIDHSGKRLRLDTPRGVVAARAAIVCVPPSLIAEGRLRFTPDLPDKVRAAEALPLGHVDKAFLALAEPDAFPADTHLFGRIDTALTGSYHLRPFGRPLIEAFIGGDLAAQLEAEGEAAFGAFAVEELVGLLGSDMRQKLTPLAASNWGQDPWTLGAYSHARPGQAGAREILAAPVEARLFFAGEACSATHFSTAHGAYLTGVAAADLAIASLGNPAGA